MAERLAIGAGTCPSVVHSSIARKDCNAVSAWKFAKFVSTGTVVNASRIRATSAVEFFANPARKPILVASATRIVAAIVDWPLCVRVVSGSFATNVNIPVFVENATIFCVENAI